ncbi:MAG: sigma-70 family RNA polymerase sigma factor [Eubacteriales bacterium]|nr:sigma-70 family RNA polymerase sigma factor [Eubacteriales bacterium]
MEQGKVQAAFTLPSHLSCAETDDVRIRRMMNDYGSSLLRMCFLYLRDDALAQDAVQDSFLKAYRKLSQFRGESGKKTWLMRIAINTCRDYQRSGWAKQVDSRICLEELPLSAEAAEPEDDTVIREVMLLPRKDREIVLLRFYQQMKIKEIAQTLKIPTGTVTSRLNRAKEKLRLRLKGWYFDEDEL